MERRVRSQAERRIPQIGSHPVTDLDDFAPERRSPREHVEVGVSLLTGEPIELAEPEPAERRRRR